MGSTGVVKDERYLEHDTGVYHVENPQRLVHMYEALEDMGAQLVHIPPRPATLEEVRAVHDPAYVERIAATDGKPPVRLDPDTVTSPRTYEIALLAAGGLLCAIDAVMDGLKNAIALVRPPGHHAERDRAKGFCIFNNAAIGAKYALARYGFERILIADWDLHHGNGTQHTFYADPAVLYVSTHQYPYYPGSGHFTEIGEGEGRGYTINIPLSYGHNEYDYANIFRHILHPVTLQFRPQLILVSAGFDIYSQDPLGGMDVSEEGFARLTDLIMEMADEVCAGRMVVTLEGGYNLEGSARSAREVVRTMLGDQTVDRGSRRQHEDEEYSRVRRLVEVVQTTLADHWHWNTS